MISYVCEESTFFVPTPKQLKEYETDKWEVIKRGTTTIYKNLNDNVYKSEHTCRCVESRKPPRYYRECKAVEYESSTERDVRIRQEKDKELAKRFPRMTIGGNYL